MAWDEYFDVWVMNIETPEYKGNLNIHPLIIFTFIKFIALDKSLYRSLESLAHAVDTLLLEQIKSTPFN